MPGSGSEVLLQTFSERQSNKWEVDLLGFREKRPFYRVPAMECGLSFASGVKSYANEREDHPSHWGTTHSSLFCHLWVCLLAYRLGIKVCSIGSN